MKVDSELPDDDASRIPIASRQVLKNLLSNAFKFTEAGEIAVRLDLATAGWDPDHERLGRAESVIAISVADTGIGIKQELQAAMFEAFAQADGTTARQYGGTGLGLSISRNLVDLLGGEITLKSAPGEGSTFTVYLPLEPLDQAAEAIIATAAAPVSRRELVAAAIPPKRRRSMTRSRRPGTAHANGTAKANGSPCRVLNDSQEAPADCRLRPRRCRHPLVTASTRVLPRESRCWWSTTTSATSSR